MQPRAAARPLVHTHPPRLALREAPRREVRLAGRLLVTCLLEFVRLQRPCPWACCIWRGWKSRQASAVRAWAPCTCPRRKVASWQVVQGWPCALGSQWSCGGSPLAKAHTSVPSSCGQEGGPYHWASWSLVGPCGAVELSLHSVFGKGTWCPYPQGSP